jgi:hypothetical protein
MGIGYRINTDLGLTVVVWHGTVTDEDCRRHLITLAEDTRWPPGPRQIADLTTLRNFAMPDPELVEILVEGLQVLDDLNLVLVMTPDDLYPKREARFKAQRTKAKMIFTDLDRASRFLEVDEATVRAMVDEAREELRDAQPA